MIVDDVDASLLRPIHELTLELGLDVLTEVRTGPELERAVAAGTYMIAVNRRSQPKDTRFTVDYNRAAEMSRLFARMDDGIVKVAASGIGVEGGTGTGGHCRSRLRRRPHRRSAGHRGRPGRQAECDAVGRGPGTSRSSLSGQGISGPLS